MASVYMVCAVAGSVVLIIMLVVNLIGLDHSVDGHLDHFDVHDDASHAFQVLSLRSLIAAIAFFGLGGALANAAGAGALFSFAVSFSSGLAAMLLVAWIMHLMLSLQEDGTLDLSLAVGVNGTCHLTVPGARAGAGKIMVTVQDRALELDAMTRGDTIPTGAPVRVVEILNSSLVEVAAEK